MEELNISMDEAEKLETIPYYFLAEAYNKVRPRVAEEGYYVGDHPYPTITIWESPLIRDIRNMQRQFLDDRFGVCGICLRKAAV